MAGTPLSDVYDIFMSQLSDYRLMALFTTSTTDFENFLESWLVYSINDFDICNQDLTFDSTTKLFAATLTSKNKTILATLMIKYWLTKNVNDITQMNLHINDRDFKIASEANNLKEKMAQLNIFKEQCSQMLIDYGYKNLDWSQWFSQNFSGG